MKKGKEIFLAVIVSLVLWGCVVPNDDILFGGQSEEQIILGLKEALQVGTDSAVSELSATNGYLSNLDSRIPIPLPDTVAKVLGFVDSLESLSTNITNSLNENALGGLFGNLLGDIIFRAFSFLELRNLSKELVSKLNEAAGVAAKTAAPIFVDAITEMSIQDGFQVLNGDDTAATTFLKDRTFEQLQSAYTPMIDSALSQVKAVQVWENFSGKYNQLVSHFNTYKGVYEGAGLSQSFSIPDSLPNNLASYTTGKALSGLFLVIGKEETRIRKDPIARVTELLKDVFGSL